MFQGLRRFCRTFHRAYDNEAGQTLVLFVLSVVVFLGLVGMSVDVGRLVVKRHPSRMPPTLQLLPPSPCSLTAAATTRPLPKQWPMRLRTGTPPESP